MTVTVQTMGEILVPDHAPRCGDAAGGTTAARALREQWRHANQVVRPEQARLLRQVIETLDGEEPTWEDAEWQ